MRTESPRRLDRKRIIGAGAWALLVAGLLLMPRDALPTPLWWVPASLGGWLDCLAHAFLFFVQAQLVVRVVRRGVDRPARRLLLALVLIYAVLLELLQIPVPGRNLQVMDMVFAGLGIGFAELSTRSRVSGAG